MIGTIVLAGSLAQRPGRGGHSWVFLQYLLGLRRLGWDVLFIDRLTPEMAINRQGAPCSIEASWNLRYFLDVFSRAELSECVSLLGRDREVVAGVPRAEVVRRVRKAVLLVNVMGYLDDEELLSAAQKRVFLDIDPGFPQLWREQGLADVFSGHDAFVTIGENIGSDGCTIPTCGLTWITTPQPVVLSEWPVADGGWSYTSVVTWRGMFGPLEHAGKRQGLRVHEFRRFLVMPSRTGVALELALDIDPADDSDRDALVKSNWRLVDPLVVAGDPGSYRRYIQSSRGEFMVAKNAYVENRGGWMSDRSLCYLASGKPVVMQDTGISDRYPTGEGLVTFSTVVEAADCIRAVEADYQRHARAARHVAETYFDSDVVLQRLLANLRAA